MSLLTLVKNMCVFDHPGVRLWQQRRGQGQGGVVVGGGGGNHGDVKAGLDTWSLAVGAAGGGGGAEGDGGVAFQSSIAVLLLDNLQSPLTSEVARAVPALLQASSVGDSANNTGGFGFGFRAARSATTSTSATSSSSSTTTTTTDRARDAARQSIVILRLTLQCLAALLEGTIWNHVRVVLLGYTTILLHVCRSTVHVLYTRLHVRTRALSHCP